MIEIEASISRQVCHHENPTSVPITFRVNSHWSTGLKKCCWFLNRQVYVRCGIRPFSFALKYCLDTICSELGNLGCGRGTYVEDFEMRSVVNSGSATLPLSQHVGYLGKTRCRIIVTAHLPEKLCRRSMVIGKDYYHGLAVVIEVHPSCPHVLMNISNSITSSL